jgi:hypothetical protein
VATIPPLIDNQLPTVGASLIHAFVGTRPPIPNPNLAELNRTPPHNGWGQDGYNTLELDPAGRVFDKVI